MKLHFYIRLDQGICLLLEGENLPGEDWEHLQPVPVSTVLLYLVNTVVEQRL